MVQVSVPGKVILMGEHAAVYGRPALVAAAGLRLTVRLAAGDPAGRPFDADDPPVQLSLPQLSIDETVGWSEILAHTRRRRAAWEAYAADPTPEAFARLAGDSPTHLVETALGEALLAGRDGAGEPTGPTAPPPLALHLTSDIPLGSGFGSSAAAAVGVIAAFLAAIGEPLDPDRLRHLSLEVERRQHGTPSGIDNATVIAGGFVWAERGDDGRLATSAVAARSPLVGHLRLYGSGAPAEPTGAVIAAVRRRRAEDPGGFDRRLDRLEELTRDLREALGETDEDPVRVAAALDGAQEVLEAIGVVPPPVRRLVRRVRAAGGAAKISGAGSLAGPGAGTLIVYHPRPEALDAVDELGRLARYPALLGAPGVRREAAS